MALIGTGEADSRPQAALAALLARLHAALGADDARAHARRVAGAAFLVRVGGAALAYLSQILLARWMGVFEFGVFVYALTWLLLLGGLVDFGLAASAQYFVPKYAGRGDAGHLRGYLDGSRRLVFALAALVAASGALAVFLLQDRLGFHAALPLYLACLTLPVFGVMNVQDGISRAYNWPYLALLPNFVLRPALLVALMGAVYAAGYAPGATTAVVLVALSVWATGLGQLVLVNRRLRATVAPARPRYDLRGWLVTALPMFVLDGIYLTLLYLDVLVLSAFRPPEDVAVYFAAVKTLALVAFVYFAVGAAALHKFAEYHVAGDRYRLQDFLASSIRWTFWPSLAATAAVLAAGWPMLRLFGESFVSGYHLLFLLAVGLLARAAVGPGERILVMLGERRRCMLVAAGALLANVALCLALIPPFGAEGAAIATSTAFVVESILLFAVAKRRLGLHLFIFGARRVGNGAHGCAESEGRTCAVARPASLQHGRKGS